MARLKDKINELKAAGLSEDLAKKVLDAYDGDMAEINAVLVSEQNKVVDWNRYWNQVNPQIQTLASEYEKLQAQVEALKAAGITIGQPQATIQTPAVQVQPQAQTPQGFDPTSFEQKIYQNFSAVQTDLEKIRKYHFDNYKTLPDIEPIEKLVSEKKLTPWAAYQEWVAPMDAKRKEDELRASITAELEQKMRNEATRNGINSHLLSNKSSLTGEEVTSPLDEVLREQAVQPRAAQNPTASAMAQATAQQNADRQASEGPSEFELMASFVSDMREGRSRLGH